MTNIKRIDEDGLIFLNDEVDEEGNVEYKLQMLDPSPERFERLVTQLKWRLGEGQGEAIYELGVADDGSPIGLSDKDLAATKGTLARMAVAMHAEVSLVLERRGLRGTIAEMLVREARTDGYVEVRVALCGDAGAGKTTLIGVLTTGVLDDGRGRVRLNIFHHKHEVMSGHTSSLQQQILGFSSSGQCLNQAQGTKPVRWGDLVEEAAKVVSFLDLAGHPNYLKTTIMGLTGYKPDYLFLVIAADGGITQTTTDHLDLALALHIPFAVIMTKTDLATPLQCDATWQAFEAALKHRKLPHVAIPVRDDQDVSRVTLQNPTTSAFPIFYLSNVRGDGLALLRRYLHVLPRRVHWKSHAREPTQVLLDQCYHVPQVGTVVCGHVVAGAVVRGDCLLVGPDSNGVFTSVNIHSIHVKQVPVKRVEAGQAAGFAITDMPVRKGMVMLAPALKPHAVWEFDADVVCAAKEMTWVSTAQPTIQCMMMRQAAKIIHVSRRDAQHMRMTFQFLYRPEYLQCGLPIVIRDGVTMSFGRITAVKAKNKPKCK